MASQLVTCRSCGDTTTCPDWTCREQEKTSHDEGRSDVSHTVTTGQCVSCLQAHGPDEHSDPPEAQDEAEARAEREYRELDRGEL